jgi:16S rRNA (cytosine967-C5)-methyltransferase
MNSRQLICRILTAFDKRPGNLERLIDHAVSGLHIDHRDRRFIFEVVYGIVRRKRTLDHVIDRYIAEENNRSDPFLRRLLRIGLYQLFYLDRVPDHASVNETVKLVKMNHCNKNYAGTVNAVLRNVIKHKKQIVLPDAKHSLPERLAIEYSHPVWMIERWLTRLGLSSVKKLLEFNNQKPSLFLRRSLRMVSRQQFEADVRLMCDVSCGYRSLYYRLKKSLLPDQLHLIRQGVCNVQAPSSGWVVALMEIKRGEHVFDLCAAPGGKTMLMAELAGEEGSVCAGELHYHRLLKVVETAERMHLRNVYPLLCDGTMSPFNGIFDKVLLDAPCSSTGVLHRHPEARWIRTADDITRLVEVQRMLLDAAVSLIGPGGTIVYATCSLEPEENELQIRRFLNGHPHFEISAIPETVPAQYVDIDGFLRISPFEHGMDGMFAACLRYRG